MISTGSACTGESQWDGGILVGRWCPPWTDLDAGEIVEAEPPRRLVIRWQNQFKARAQGEGESLWHDGTGTQWNGGQALHHPHQRARTSKFIAAVSGRLPKIISNLKSLLETGPPSAGPVPDGQSAVDAYGQPLTPIESAAV